MKDQSQRVVLDISWLALLKVLAFVVGIWIVISIREVLIMLFGSFILVAAINPTITRWQKYMSRVLAVSLFYTILIGVIAVLTWVFVPTFIRQLNELAHALPGIVDQAKPFIESLPSGSSSVVEQATESFKNSLANYSQSLFATTLNFFGGLAVLITGAVVSFYLLLEERNARRFLKEVFPPHRFEAAYNTINKISERMGSWVRGQVILMVIIGVANLVAYYAIGLDSPLPLALWAGLCEVIPYLGPTLGLLPALIVALATGNVLQAILVVVIGYIVIQQLESTFIVPRVMSKAVGLSPVLVILALAIGFKLFGLIGALLAVPVAAIISVVVGEWPELRKIWEAGEEE